MSVVRLSLFGAAAALILASATPAAAGGFGYEGGGAIVNCVRSICNFGARGYRHHHRHHHRHFGYWGEGRIITASPYYLVDQGPVYNIPAIAYREPSVAYDIDAGAYPYVGWRTYGPRRFYGGTRYRSHWRHGFHHGHRAYRHVRYSARYGKPYFPRHHGHGHHHHRHGAWR
ncbi:MAG: hypothetical protein AB7K64_07215 [Variibacter sp.]